MTEYDPADDARTSYDFAVEAKRQRGDKHWPKRLSPQNSEKSSMTDTPIDFIAEAITDSLGPRCPDHSADCPTCEAWAEYDRLKGIAALYDQKKPPVVMVPDDATAEEILQSTIDHPNAVVMLKRMPDARASAVEKAARNLIAVRYDTYKARNGNLCSIEGDDGEKAWIVPFDAMADLESALSSPDHADAGKVEGDGNRWRIFEAACARGYWGIELEQASNDDEPILYPIKVHRDILVRIVEAHNTALPSAPSKEVAGS